VKKLSKCLFDSFVPEKFELESSLLALPAKVAVEFSRPFEFDVGLKTIPTSKYFRKSNALSIDLDHDLDPNKDNLPRTTSTADKT